MADGYYILYLRNRRVAAGLPQPNVTVNLQQVFLPLTEKAAKAEIDTRLALARKISQSTQSCINLEKVGKEMGSRQSGRLDNVNLNNLPQNIRSAVQSLQIGEASKPVQTAAGVIVLMVCKKAGQASESQVREQIRLQLMQRRAQLLARRMLRDLRNSAYVDKRKCPFTIL